MKCPKCNEEMKEGITKRTGIFNIFSKEFWTTRIKMISDPDLRYIKTWRCESCGYLESYAKDKGE